MQYSSVTTEFHEAVAAPLGRILQSVLAERRSEE
jgi:hypothetical protein